MAPVVRARLAARGAVPARHHLRRRGALRPQPDDLPPDDRHAVAAHRGTAATPRTRTPSGSPTSACGSAACSGSPDRDAARGRVRRPPARPRPDLAERADPRGRHRARGAERPGARSPLEGARIIRHAEGLDTVAGYVEAQTTPLPAGARARRGGAAREPDHQGGQRLRRPHRRARRPRARSRRAIERIHLGLGYEYDPEVVEALAVATADATVGRVGEREPVAR